MSVQNKATNKPRLIALKDITLDPQLQARTKVDERHIEEMAEVIKAGERLRGELPVVFSAGNANWLADGFQRHAAHLLAGEKKMECDVRHGNFEDAQRYAMREANVGHGLKLDDAAVSRKIEWHVSHEKYQHFSDEQIAKWCHIDRGWVTRIRQGNSCDDTSCTPEIPECLLQPDPEIKVEHKHKVQWQKIVEAGGLPRFFFKGGTLTLMDIGGKRKAQAETKAKKEEKERQEAEERKDRYEKLAGNILGHWWANGSIVLPNELPTDHGCDSDTVRQAYYLVSITEVKARGVLNGFTIDLVAAWTRYEPNIDDVGLAKLCGISLENVIECRQIGSSKRLYSQEGNAQTGEQPSQEGSASPTSNSNVNASRPGAAPSSDDKLAKAVAWVVQVWKDYERVHPPSVVADTHKLTIAEAEQVIADATWEFDQDEQVDAFTAAALEMYLTQRPDISNDDLGKLLSMDFQEVANLRGRPEWEGPDPRMTRHWSSPTQGTTSQHPAP